jgi:hypothetical protein
MKHGSNTDKIKDSFRSWRVDPISGWTPFALFSISAAQTLVRDATASHQ